MTPLQVEEVGCTVCGARAATVEATGKDYLHGTSDQTYTYAKCSDCAHLYLNPRPQISEIDRLYPADYATYTKKFSASRSILARLKDAILLRRFRSAGVPMTTGSRVMDVGCGDAAFLISLRRIYPDIELYGLDWYFGPAVAEDMEAAKIVQLTGTIETLDLPEASFDMINMNQLIEHVWDVPLVLERCMAALKPGGYLVLETPNPDGWDRPFFRTGAWGGYYWPRHLNLFSSDNLVRVVEQAGFAVRKRQNLLAPPCWIYSLQFSLKRRGNARAAKLAPDNSVPLLAFFAMIDLVAKTFGLTTSNQKLIAQKPV